VLINRVLRVHMYLPAEEDPLDNGQLGSAADHKAIVSFYDTFARITDTSSIT